MPAVTTEPIVLATWGLVAVTGLLVLVTVGLVYVGWHQVRQARTTTEEVRRQTAELGREADAALRAVEATRDMVIEMRADRAFRDPFKLALDVECRAAGHCRLVFANIHERPMHTTNIVVRQVAPPPAAPLYEQKLDVTIAPASDWEYMFAYDYVRVGLIAVELDGRPVGGIPQRLEFRLQRGDDGRLTPAGPPGWCIFATQKG